jgi:tellurite resistance protein
MDQEQRLQNFPVAFFAMVMGMSGLTLAWEKSHAVLNMPVIVSKVLLLFTVGLFLVLVSIFLIKLIRHPGAVIKDLGHPIKLSFFPTISISLILLGICTLHDYKNVSFLLWTVGSVAHLLFTLYVMQVWMHHEHFEIHHMNPAWFIPIVGNILVPIAGVEHGYVEVSTFFFSIGLLFWIVLLGIIFNRVIFHQPLPEKLFPTLFILIAPPAIGFISYVKLNGDVDIFARVLYYSALFLTLLLFTQIPRFTKLKFFLSWWAYSFPMAAITIATLLMFQKTGQIWFKITGLGLLGIITLLISFLVYKTVIAIGMKQICVAEG